MNPLIFAGMMKPTLGRIVLYRSRTGNYDCAAIVTATKDTLDPEGVRMGHVPELSSEHHVHLTVFTPGRPGTSREQEGAVQLIGGPPPSMNQGGSYSEWNIPAYLDDPAPGTWRWP